MTMHSKGDYVLPDINGREAFDGLVVKLSEYFVRYLHEAHTFEELKHVTRVPQLQALTGYLVNSVHHLGIISALLALKWHFTTIDEGDDIGLNETRGLACEVVAWRFITHLTEAEAIDYLCYELPAVKTRQFSFLSRTDSRSDCARAQDATERTPLVGDGPSASEEADEADPDGDNAAVPQGSATFSATFEGLNALEIAAVVGAKKLLSQRAVQRIIDGIWEGDIVFWETLSAHSTKQAKVYNKDRSDPFCRLRVPLYSKLFEVLFFAVFLGLYYTVLIQKSSHAITAAEGLLYLWILAFAHNEFGEFWDAGSVFYATDFWSLWDLGIIVTGVVYIVIRIIGLVNDDEYLTENAFDVLSVEALFLVPRICSLLSLHPYFGTLLPCLKEMTKDFVKFLGLVAILYIGFDTTFAFLARGTFSVGKMNWILVKVFFGSSYLGFDIAEKISPVLGPPLMFIFVCMTNILLITSLISLLSNTLTKVIEHAREEYLLVYAIFVLEASNSNRLTYFIPPLNLLSLVLRPLRLVIPAETLRRTRIILLKSTHWPFVAMILLYETGRLHWGRQRATTSREEDGHLLGGKNSNLMFRRSLSARPRPQSLLRVGSLHARFDSWSSRAIPEALPTSDVAPQSLGPVLDTISSLEETMQHLQKQLDSLKSSVQSDRSVNGSSTTRKRHSESFE